MSRACGNFAMVVDRKLQRTLGLGDGVRRSRTTPAPEVVKTKEALRRSPVQAPPAAQSVPPHRCWPGRGKLAWMMLFGVFLVVDSSKYLVDVKAMSSAHIAQAVVFSQDLLSVILCLLAVLRYEGVKGIPATFCSMELLRCFPTAALFSLGSASMAHAFSLGVGAATAVALNTLYMPMCAFVSRWMFRRAYGWLEIHALALLTFSSLTFCELRSRVIGLRSGIQGATFVILSGIFACLACLLAERIFKQRHAQREEVERYCVQKARFDFWGLLTSALILFYLGEPPSPQLYRDWHYIQVGAVLLRVVQTLMGCLLVKHWSTVAKAVLQCLSMLLVFFFGDVAFLNRGQGNLCIYMLALLVSLAAFMYQLGRRQTAHLLQAASEESVAETCESEASFSSFQRTFSDPTDNRGGRSLLQRQRASTEEVQPIDVQVCCPSEFAPVSPSQLLSQRLPRLPEVDQLELLDQGWLAQERSRNSQFVAWISSKSGVLVQLLCVAIFVFFDSARTIVNDQFIRSAPIVSQSVTFAQFGASVVVGLLVTGLVDGLPGLREALAWKDVLRSFPVAACFSLSQTFTIMAYSAGVSGMENTVVGNVYLPLSALLSRWIFRRSYSFLEWIALTALMLSASVFVLLQQSPSGQVSSHIFSTGILFVILSVCMSCLASMLSEKIMKAGSSPFYIQKVTLDIGSFLTSIVMLFVCGVASQRPNDAFWKTRDVSGRMEAGIFVAWDARMVLVLVVTLLQNWLAGLVAKRLSTVIRSSAQQISLLIVYFVGDIWLNHVVFDWTL
ncbi:unnamed protein product [Symbiodinium natans]|uniref:Uncharacterized protein n=1 Tax=Symbiodinium natans TaxID=878477 RepID=A0A812PRX2_9DINO|nr:unnamed protein product [Symbiodinium natans]